MGNCQNISSGNDPIKAQKIKKNNGNNLTIKTYTWNRDSHGLFDYESKGIIKSQLKLPEPSIILREKEEIKLIPLQNYKGDSGDQKKLVGVNIRDNHYVVDSQFLSNSREEDKKQDEEGIGDHCVWAVVKSLTTSKGSKGYEIQVGDYLKLGRVRFRIKELQGLDSDKKEGTLNKNFYFDSNVNVLNMDDLALNQDVDKELAADKGENACRICLGDGEEEDNPFITPCKCDGTMKCIHVKCLQQWLKSRLHPKETPFSISFVWKTFDCELCKSQFPNKIKVKGTIYDTVEIPRPSAPYITLEILSKDKNICKGIHVITLSQKNQIKLGRGHDSDIRISDISVSRCHASLSYDSGKFTIEDNNSKFGTLALIKDPIQLSNSNNNIAIQVGRTVLSFILKKNWKIYSVPIQPQASRQTEASYENKDQPEKKVGAKIKVIEAPGQKDIENVMNLERLAESPDNQQNKNIANPLPEGGDYNFTQKQQQHQNQGGIQLNQKEKSPFQNEKNNSDDEKGEEAQQNRDQGESQIKNFQLPEFKDPAEELEAFQKQMEKEQEISTLEQQIGLLKQHRSLNQQHLTASNEEQNSTVDKQLLKHRIEQYTQKIQELESQITQLRFLHQNNVAPKNKIKASGIPDEIKAQNNIGSERVIGLDNMNAESQQSESRFK